MYNGMYNDSKKPIVLNYIESCKNILSCHEEEYIASPNVNANENI